MAPGEQAVEMADDGAAAGRGRSTSAATPALAGAAMPGERVAELADLGLLARDGSRLRRNAGRAAAARRGAAAAARLARQQLAEAVELLEGRVADADLARLPAGPVLDADLEPQRGGAGPPRGRGCRRPSRQGAELAAACRSALRRAPAPRSAGPTGRGRPPAGRATPGSPPIRAPGRDRRSGGRRAAWSSTGSGRVSSRSRLAMWLRLLPSASASRSWVWPKRSISCR